MKKITINLTNQKLDSWVWLLSRRYGKKYSIETLFKMAIYEMIEAEAEKVIKESKDET